MNAILPMIVKTLEVSPVVEWDALSPLLVLLGAAVLATLIEAFPWPGFRKGVNAFLTFASIIAAIILVAWRFSVVGQQGARQIAAGTLFEDQLSLGFQLVLLVVGLLAAIVVIDRTTPNDGSFTPQAADTPGSSQENYAIKIRYQRTEMYALFLYSLGGMMAFISSGNLLTLFVALELMSLPLYIMSAMGRRRRLLSQEAGLKYFILGAFASAFFLMGITMLYGFTGTLSMVEMSNAVSLNSGLDWMLLTGGAMLLVGLFFKVSAVPFHAWAPDVYQGAPSPISGFMAAGVKVAAFGALLHLYSFLYTQLSWDFVVLMWMVIIATIVVGTFLGIVQTDVKRMLAYSSIAHVGFIMIALFGTTGSAFTSIVFYVLAYGVATIGAFAVVSIVRDEDAEGTVRGEASALSSWDGLGRKHPAMAAAMAIFLLSFAGIPLTGGFIGKFVVFEAGLAADPANGILVLIGLLASVVTAFFYFRVIMRMFFTEPGSDTATISAGDGLTKCVIVLCALATIALGVASQPLLALFTLGA